LEREDGLDRNNFAIDWNADPNNSGGLVVILKSLDRGFERWTVMPDNGHGIIPATALADFKPDEDIDVTFMRGDYVCRNVPVAALGRDMNVHWDVKTSVSGIVSLRN
jgi:hypothetical protein